MSVWRCVSQKSEVTPANGVWFTVRFEALEQPCPPAETPLRSLARFELRVPFGACGGFEIGSDYEDPLSMLRLPVK